MENVELVKAVYSAEFVLAEPEFTGLGGVYEGHRGYVRAATF